MTGPSLAIQIKSALVRAGRGLGQWLHPRAQAELQHIQRIMPDEAKIDPIELQFILSFVRRRKPETVVEIGSYCGATTVVVAHYLERNKRGQIHTIDPFEDVYTDEFYHANYEAIFDRNIAPFKHRVVKIRGLSWEVGWDQPIDLLFVDGDHSHQAVARDMAAFLPYLRPGGVALFHDYKPEGKPGVKDNIDTKLLHNPDYRLLGTVGSLIAFERLR
jgi:predicted O-methyltransferase YrrM